MSMNEIADQIMEWRVGNGFVTPHDVDTAIFPQDLTFGDAMLGKLMLVCSEVAEAAEAARDGDRENFAEELADVIIRVFDICATVGIDIDEAVAEKMERNSQRDFRHGRKTTL